MGWSIRGGVTAGYWSVGPGDDAWSEFPPMSKALTTAAEILPGREDLGRYS